MAQTYNNFTEGDNMIRLSKNEREVLDRFRTVCCMHHKRLDPSQEQDWFSMSLGFFVASGIGIDRSHTLAIHVRYELIYCDCFLGGY